ncbi:M67 family metallopeptidase, partial [Candidatus Bathyarchaeota archaeon]|nr:M67 family metallopeptidase [Candidatus Bathyarchaeota archaeon]
MDAILDHSRRCYPYEACGILAGFKDGSVKTVEKVYPITNILVSPAAYRMDPQEQVKAFEDAERHG